MESERRINWISLFIKIIIIFIFILIIIWLLSKIIGRNKLSSTFNTNINNMEKVAVDYFKTIDLPLEKGKSTKITLKEMIDKKLIVSINKDGKNTCDTEKSYSKITRQKKNYLVKTTLDCGKEKNTITKKFSLKDCKNCQEELKKQEEAKKTKEDNKKNKNKTSNNESKEKENNSSTSESNNSSSNSSSSTSGTTYYEYVKETTSYSKWMRGEVTGNNVENRYEYYGIAKDTYYTLGYIRKNDNSNTYTVKLDKVPNSKYYFTTIESAQYYDASEEGKYKSANTSLDKKLSVPSSISEYAMKDGDFTYKLSPYYRKGSFYIDVDVRSNGSANKEYYDNNLKDTIYLVPLKITVKFASNEISDKKPSGDYETITYYRYVETNREVIWSDKSSVDGYTKTGNTKVE